MNKWLLLVEAEEHLQDFINHFRGRTFRNEYELAHCRCEFFAERNLMHISDAYNILRVIDSDGKWYIVNICVNIFKYYLKKMI